MSDPKILTSPNANSQPFLLTRLRRRLLKHLFIVRAILFAAFMFLAVQLIRIAAPSLYDGLAFLATTPQIALKFLRGPDPKIAGFPGRTNLLILGLSDPEKTGSDLTDTIIFVSVNLETGDSLLVSIPRDIWVSSLKSKINSAFFYGEKKKPNGGGIALIKSSVSEVLDQPIHYVARINFSSFKTFIDSIGGVDVTVVNSFDDYMYPVPGMETAEPESRRYEHVHFDAGKQHLDGPTALKFARSRHAVGDEGTDFARSERQKQLIIAVKNKLLTKEIILNFEKLKEIISLANSSVETDFPQDLLVSLGKPLLKVTKLSPRVGNIATFLTNPAPRLYSGQYVLVPATGDWNAVQNYLKCLTENSRDCTGLVPTPIPTINNSH